jgi:hypothetical protein
MTALAHVSLIFLSVRRSGASPILSLQASADTQALSIRLCRSEPRSQYADCCGAIHFIGGRGVQQVIEAARELMRENGIEEADVEGVYPQPVPAIGSSSATNIWSVLGLRGVGVSSLSRL